MSWQALDWALTFADLTVSEKFVFSIIAKYFNENEQFAWPSIATIAADTGVSERHVSRTLQSLHQIGLIEIVPRFERPSGRQASSAYLLPLYSDRSERSKLPGIESVDLSVASRRRARPPRDHSHPGDAP